MRNPFMSVLRLGAQLVPPVLLSACGTGALRQNSDNTICRAPARVPMPLPPASTTPSARARMSPFFLMIASNELSLRNREETPGCGG
jgi:hypothetical protein